MRPGFARVVMTLIVLAVAAVSTTFVNSRYHDSFLIGIALVVAPFLFLSFALPHLLPARTFAWTQTGSVVEFLS